jgi:hypothetical protein
MPRGDRTGPTGTGPMTGRAAGYCAGYDVPGYANSAVGRGFGRGGGRGGGWRWRHWFYATGLPGWARFGPPAAWATPTPEQEVESLRAQAERLQSQLDAVHQRVQELEKEP